MICLAHGSLGECHEQGSLTVVGWHMYYNGTQASVKALEYDFTMICLAHGRVPRVRQSCCRVDYGLNCIIMVPKPLLRC